jgi:hypothetical protein
MTRFRFETRPLPALTRYYLVVRQLPISAFLSRRSLVRRRISFSAFSFSAVLFRGLLLFLGEREALRLFAAGRTFPNVVSALAVSHNAPTLVLPPPVPSTFVALRFRHSSFVIWSY